MSAAPALKQFPKHIKGKTIIATLPKKLAKRAILNQNQHHRRSIEYGRKVLRSKIGMEKRNWNRRNAHFTQQIRDAREWRKEDWMKGPLAPKRDVGAQEGLFGAIHVDQLYMGPKAEPKDFGIVQGDRVCVVNKAHRECGKIGKVTQVRKDSEEVVVEGVNRTNVAVPPYMLLRETDKTPVRPYDAGMSMRDVRLVAPLPDPETGKLKDHIINELDLQKITAREKKGLDPPTRFIAALDPPQHIPYPAVPDETENAQEFDFDTLRIEVDERTWVPTMHMPPMPSKVLDELRGKFSKFRFRHDEEYLEKVRKEERKELRKERKGRMMMTPVKQRRRIERLERKVMGRPELDEGALAAIGEMMERNAEAAVGEGKDVLPIPTAS